ncbi:MAG: flagellar biosynthetic protein FliO [Candidatus Coatesbacteria bacterium]|nr:flagellar biosynthetic protein FliO [Candidatus Coatesbacteria bacterium]
MSRPITAIAILAFLCFIACGVPVLCQEDYLDRELGGLSSPPPSGTSPPEEPSFASLSIRMFIVLLVIIGMIILLGFGMKKFMRGKRFGSGRIATVLSVTHIVERKYIAVVEVLGRTLIVGVGADSVNLLADIGPTMPLEGGTAEEAASDSGNTQNKAEFSEVLADKISGMESEQATSFLDDLTEQVKKKISRLER